MALHDAFDRLHVAQHGAALIAQGMAMLDDIVEALVAHYQAEKLKQVTVAA